MPARASAVSMALLRHLIKIGVLAGALTVAAAGTADAQPTASGDFDGDGRSDLAIGAPMDSVGGHDDAGAVNVLYGSAGSGLREDADQEFTQDTLGVIATAEANDRFGAALAAGDFDDDGDDDLAIGLPGGRINGVRAGAVSVLYSSRGRLGQAGDQLWSQGAPGVKGAVGNDGFGWSLGAGASR